MRALRILALAAALLLPACEGATEILLVVDTTRANVQSLRVQATLPEGEVEMATADLRELPAPRRLLFVHRAGALGPLRLEIGATGGPNPALLTRRVVRFEPGQRLELPVVLGPGCEPLACAPRLSCGNDGACRSPDVSACEYVGRSCDEDPVVLPDAGP